MVKNDVIDSIKQSIIVSFQIYENYVFFCFNSEHEFLVIIASDAKPANEFRMLCGCFMNVDFVAPIVLWMLMWVSA